MRKAGKYHDSKKCRGEKRHGKANMEDAREFDNMAWRNICVRNNWHHLRQEAVDKCDNQDHTKWTIRER